MTRRKPEECCASCRYSRIIGGRLLCYGQRFAPEVAPGGWCDGYMPKAKSEWVSPKVLRPKSFISVQVYIPAQAPFPTVREGYLVNDQLGEPAYWFVPALAESFTLYDVCAWKPFVAPTAEEMAGIEHGT